MSSQAKLCFKAAAASAEEADAAGHEEENLHGGHDKGEANSLNATVNEKGGVLLDITKKPQVLSP